MFPRSVGCGGDGRVEDNDDNDDIMMICLTLRYVTARGENEGEMGL